ncbi:MAG: patatin-like phospholipase family protein, partial [Deltaproteobacteria bacterium]|nr:patatin-like phospholipase family protein [Deltaproteobacteria bacterium]
GRSELSAEYYDEILFKGGTFGDIAVAGGPLIRINATDAGFGLQFSFVPELFNALCSDLSEFSVARAVTASSAVPVLFNSLTVRNYAGTCDYQMPAWMQMALKERDSTSRRYRLATQYVKYLDREEKPYIHLYDGGLSDNIGLRTYLNLLTLMGDAYEAVKHSGFVDIRRLLILVVNAQAELEPKSDHDEGSLGLTETIMSSSSIPLNEYTFESMTLLRWLTRQMEQRIVDHRCADYMAQGKPTEGCEDIRVYVVEVNFDSLPEEKDRKYLKHLPTSFRLKPEEVDKLRWAAREILANSTEFQRFLNELN